MSTDWNTWEHESDEFECEEGCPFCRIEKLEAAARVAIAELEYAERHHSAMPHAREGLIEALK